MLYATYTDLHRSLCSRGPREAAHFYNALRRLCSHATRNFSLIARHIIYHTVFFLSSPRTNPLLSSRYKTSPSYWYPCLICFILISSSVIGSTSYLKGKGLTLWQSQFLYEVGRLLNICRLPKGFEIYLCLCNKFHV